MKTALCSPTLLTDFLIFVEETKDMFLMMMGNRGFGFIAKIYALNVKEQQFL